jgi:hypothetical protein
MIGTIKRNLSKMELYSMIVDGKYNSLEDAIVKIIAGKCATNLIEIK